MQVTINSNTICGKIVAPPSKSYTQRAYAGALLHTGKTIIYNAGTSDDECVALQIIEQLGAMIENETTKDKDEKNICYKCKIINSKGVVPIADNFSCGESGLSARLFTPIAALCSSEIKIDATGSLLRRPLSEMELVLKEMGVTFSNWTGYLPFSLKGKLIPKNSIINAGNSSQFLTGLLFALSSCAVEPITISVSKLESKPYIDLSLEVLEKFGRPIHNNNYKEFLIDPSCFKLQDEVRISVEGDWSSAAFLLVAGAIAGEITVSNLNAASKQADKAILQVLQSAGASLVANEGSITTKRSRLKSFDFDATHCPDLFPILAILAALCEGESNIMGVHRLFYKESNRAESITEMLESFDVPFSVENDILSISGVQQLQGTVIDSYNDHRIAMAAAVGALRAGSRVDIINAGVVKKSYPNFYTDLQSCGVELQIK